MAKNAFDELLESITEEPDRKALSEIAAKVPELKNSVLRQSDYSRNMDALQKEKRELQTQIDSLQRWESWAKENYVYDGRGKGKGATKRELEIERQLADARKQMSELEQQIQVGGEVTYEQLGEHFRKLKADNGLATREDVEAATTNVRTEVGATAKNFADAMNGYVGVTLELPTLVVKHQQEFGEVLDTKALWETVTKGNYPSIGKAYDDFIGPRRKEKQDADHKAEIEAAKKAGRDEAFKERGMNPAAMPDDQTGPVSPLVAMMNKFGGAAAGADGKADLSNVALGSGTLARVAAREMGTPGSATN